MEKLKHVRMNIFTSPLRIASVCALQKSSYIYTETGSYTHSLGISKLTQKMKENKKMNNMKKVAEEILGRALTEKDGIDTGEIEAVENSLNLTLPKELKDFYLFVGNLEMFMSSFENFLKPYIKNDKLVFLEENQSACYWGFNTGETKSNLVYMCTDIESEIPEWYSEETTLADFLTILMYYQTAQGGYDFGGAVYESNFDTKQAYLKFLTNITTDYKKVVEHNGVVIYQNSGKLIWHFTDSEGSLADIIFALTRTAEDMKGLELLGFTDL